MLYFRPQKEAERCCAMGEAKQAQTPYEHMELPRDEPITFKLYCGADYVEAVLRASLEGTPDEDTIVLADAVVTLAQRLMSSAPPKCMLCRAPTPYPGLIGCLRGAHKTRSSLVIVTCKRCAATAPGDKLRGVVLARLGIEEIETSSWAS
jgi:hypothetical protein